MNGVRVFSLCVVAAVLLWAPSVSVADDASVEAAYRAGETSLDGPLRAGERASRAIERAGSERAFRRAGRRLLRAMRSARGPLTRWRGAVAREQPSTPTGGEAKRAALAGLDSLRAATRASGRGVRLLLRALIRDSPRELRRALRELRRVDRLSARVERFGAVAERLFDKARVDRGLQPGPTPWP